MMCVFSPSDILLPGSDVSFELWSVVACDQFTSEREYWERVKKKVGNSPSTLNMIIPEVYLEDIHKDNEASEIEKIRSIMDSYVSNGIFREVKDSYIFVERTLSDGQVRKGLIGALDLEEYEFSTKVTSEITIKHKTRHCGLDPQSPEISTVVASEGTALDRLPPRIRVRQAASLELPHIMVLVADENQTIIEPLEKKTKVLEPLYDFELMEGGGRLRGTKVSGSDSIDVMKALDKLHNEKKAMKPPQCLMIMGDGNHSLAAAKNHWNEIKKNLNSVEKKAHPARFALVEINNLYDPVISFEPIHRVVIDVDIDKFLSAISDFISAFVAASEFAEDGSLKSASIDKSGGGYALRVLTQNGEKSFIMAYKSASALIGAVQEFLDEYIAKFGGRIDYIHDINTLNSLVKDGNAVGILLPSITKQEFLETVADGRILPRKSFSIGHAEDKRYYMECRLISN